MMITKRRKRMRTVLLILVAVLVSGLELNIYVKNYRQKKYTKALFGMLYMTKTLCSGAGEGDVLHGDAAVRRFVNSYPELIRVLSESPYLPVSIDEFFHFLNDNKTSFGNLSSPYSGHMYQSCHQGIDTLNSMSDMAGTADMNKILLNYYSIIGNRSKIFW